MERRKIAEGNTAEIFEIDDEKILKLFKTGRSKNDAYCEYENHRMVSKSAKNVPKPFEFIDENRRFGFTMEKAQGKILQR